MDKEQLKKGEMLEREIYSLKAHIKNWNSEFAVDDLHIAQNSALDVTFSLSRFMGPKEFNMVKLLTIGLLKQCLDKKEQEFTNL